MWLITMLIQFVISALALDAGISAADVNLVHMQVGYLDGMSALYMWVYGSIQR